MFGCLFENLVALSPFLLLLLWFAFLPVLYALRGTLGIEEMGIYHSAFFIGSYVFLPILGLIAFIDGILHLRRRKRAIGFLNLIAGLFAGAVLVVLVLLNLGVIPS